MRPHADPSRLARGGPWGDAPDAPTTQWVDKAATGAQLGTQALPWHTVQYGVVNAEPGATVAVAPGVYTEVVNVSKAVTIVGRCPAEVVINSAGGFGAVVTALAPGVVLQKVALTGPTPGAAAGGGSLTLDRVWIHDVTGGGVQARPGTQVTVLSSLIEDATSGGALNEGAELVIEDSVIRRIVPVTGAGGEGVLARAVAGAPVTTIVHSRIEEAARVGVHSAAGEIEVVATLVRDSHETGVAGGGRSHLGGERHRGGRRHRTGDRAEHPLDLGRAHRWRSRGRDHDLRELRVAGAIARGHPRRRGLRDAGGGDPRARLRRSPR